MLTQCPNCQTIYQISAGELGAAKGFVECGECSVQFNALDRIADEPQFDSESAVVTEPVSQAATPAPTFVLIEDSDSPVDNDAQDSRDADQQLPAADIQPEQSDFDSSDNTSNSSPESFGGQDDLHDKVSVKETDEHDKTLELVVLTDESAVDNANAPSVDDVLHDHVETRVGESTTDSPHVDIAFDNLQPPSSASLPPEEHEILFSDPGLDDVEDSVVPHGASDGIEVSPETKIDLDEVPPILQEELLAMQDPKPSGSSFFWTLCAVILLVAISVQASWHYRDILLERFPIAAPYVEQACALIGCEVSNAQPVEPIQLLSRDVRTHPRYENSLLVNASMVNTGAETIAFPTVQLGLFDPTGTAIGIRQFSPKEYLDKSIELEAGIPPGRSVHVVLELANTGEEATSFEFSFH